LTKAGVYTEEQRQQILVTFGANGFLKAKPELSQAHRVRSVMQTYFFIKEGAIIVNNGVINLDTEKMVKAARKTLTEIIEVQLSQSFERGEKYVNDYFVWSDDFKVMSEKLKEIDKSLNGMITTPLADKLLSE